MNPLPLILALCAAAAAPGLFGAAGLGAPSAAVYAAEVAPQLYGATLLPRYIAERPGIWANMRQRIDSQGTHYVDWVDGRGLILASLCPADLCGGTDGVSEIRRANTAFYRAAGAVGSVVVRIRTRTGAFSVGEGEPTSRPECPAVPARVAEMSLP